MKTYSYLFVLLAGFPLLTGCESNKVSQEFSDLYNRQNSPYRFVCSIVKSPSDSISNYKLLLSVLPRHKDTNGFTLRFSPSGKIIGTEWIVIPLRKPGADTIRVPSQMMLVEDKIVFNYPFISDLSIVTMSMPPIAPIIPQLGETQKVSGTHQEHTHLGELKFYNFDGTYMYKGDTTLLINNSPIICNHFKALSISGSTKVHHQYWFNKDHGFVRAEYRELNGTKVIIEQQL